MCAATILIHNGRHSHHTLFEKFCSLEYFSFRRRHMMDTLLLVKQFHIVVCFTDLPQQNHVAQFVILIVPNYIKTTPDRRQK